MKKTLFTVLLIVSIALSVTVMSCSGEVKAKSSENYITFSTEDNSKFTLTIPCVFDGKLYYSTEDPKDSSSWKEVIASRTDIWVSTPASCTDLTAENGKLYLRGKDNNKISGQDSLGFYWIISATSGVSLSGNIMTLLNCDNPATTMTGDNASCFHSLFKNCTSLTDISGLTLPATELADACYQHMFFGTRIESAPELPATTMKVQCYSNMFRDCTNLIDAPELSAKTLASSCYLCMFYGCKSLHVTTNSDFAAQQKGKILTCSSSTSVVNCMFRDIAEPGIGNNGTPTSGTDYYWYIPDPV